MDSLGRCDRLTSFFKIGFVKPSYGQRRKKEENRHPFWGLQALWQCRRFSLRKGNPNFRRYKKGRRPPGWGDAALRAEIGTRKQREHRVLEERAKDFAPLRDVPLGTSCFLYRREEIKRKPKRLRRPASGRVS